MIRIYTYVLVQAVLVLIAEWAYAESALSPTRIPRTFHGEIMGTQWNVTAIHGGTSGSDMADSQILQRIEDVLKKVDDTMSTWKENSELSKLNRYTGKEPMLVSEDLAVVLSMARLIGMKSGGAYDVTVGPLVNLWKFGPGESLPHGCKAEKIREFPTEEEISEMRKKVGWNKLILSDERKKAETLSSDMAVADKHLGMAVKKMSPDIYIDLSSIAKGYAVDRVADLLYDLGFRDYMVEVGGEVVCSGRNSQGALWRMGIEKPIPEVHDLYGVVNVTDMSLATSGDYRNYRVSGTSGEHGQNLQNVNPMRYSHIIDPRTGYPVNHHLVSVSVLERTCLEADAWATALMVLGPDDGVKLAQAEGIQALFLIQEGNELLEMSTSGFPLVKKRVEEIKKESPWRVVFIYALLFIFTLCLFGFYFVAIGLAQLLGYRKMMCACKSARVMEQKREQLIKTIKPIKRGEEIADDADDEV